MEGKTTGAAGPRRSSDGAGGGSGPPELRVPATASGCRGVEGPSPESPGMAMSDHQVKARLERKDDDDGRLGADVTGIAVKRGSSRGVTGIAVEIRSRRGVTGIAVGNRSRRGGDGDRHRKQEHEGVTGIAVRSRSARE
ncbi:hypothetical protein Taro_020640 [Colocasia esculenta]|uniref:Uncharacterized protein n=1 Tax=Colocasia esculenta TaxID=4460 RepID=A0A843V937_COLES|nr:hypothetical protein [Colocasia esculenta]